jgi:hypothetical protein
VKFLNAFVLIHLLGAGLLTSDLDLISGDKAREALLEALFDGSRASGVLIEVPVESHLGIHLIHILPPGPAGARIGEGEFGKGESYSQRSSVWVQFSRVPKR